MVRYLSLIAGAAAVVIPGSLIAAVEGAPARQPGSWSHVLTVKRMEGPGAAEARPAMEQMFAAMAKISVCVTPAMAASEDPLSNVNAFTGRGATCTWATRTVTDGQLNLIGSCKEPDGAVNKITATGTMTATDRNIDLTIDGAKADGSREGLMQMQLRAIRNGECTAKDLKEPPPAAL